MDKNKYLSLRLKFLNAIKSVGIPDGSDIVIAVSGGADSTALLWFFHSFWTGKLIVAHAEHGMRGQISLDDAERVRSLAEEWGAEYVIKHIRVRDNKRYDESEEMAGRRLRYEFFEEVYKCHNAAGVALGHNRSDVAETVLLNIFRGTGARGLAGIPPRRGIFFRPVIQFSREFLRDLLTELGITWREDSSNAENDYQRNRLRNIIMPEIEQMINPRAYEHLAALAEEMYELRQKDEQETARLISALSHNEDSANILWAGVIKKMRALDDFQLKLVLRGLGHKFLLRTLSRERTNGLSSLIRRSGRFVFQWQRNICVTAENGFIRLMSERS